MVFLSILGVFSHVLSGLVRRTSQRFPHNKSYWQMYFPYQNLWMMGQKIKKTRSYELPPARMLSAGSRIASRFLSPGRCPHVYVHARPRLDIKGLEPSSWSERVTSHLVLALHLVDEALPSRVGIVNDSIVLVVFDSR